MLVNDKHYRTVWMKDSSVFLINQPLIPHKFEIFECKNHKVTATSISDMIVRGAGAIGATAGFGIAQVALEAPNENFGAYINKGTETIKNTRPTAQNLFTAVNRVLSVIEKQTSPETARKAALAEAQAIADEDAAACKKIGEYGETLIKDGYKIQTHCNAGWLAFVDWGSAIAPVYMAKQKGKKVFVYTDVTGPRNQGSRLTSWELLNEGVEHAIVADNACAYLMSRGEVDMMIVGADRIAVNGDTANKIGTFEKALVAKKFNVPFYVAAPLSTFDLNSKSGKDIPIELRSENEVLNAYGWIDGKFKPVRISPKGAKAINPAFDVTPAEYITGIITEKGILSPNEESITKVF